MKYFTHARRGKSLEYFGIMWSKSVRLHSGFTFTNSTASFAFMIFSFRRLLLFSRRASKTPQLFQLFGGFEIGDFHIFGTSVRLWLLPYPPALY
jgi:hypothetical protein